MKKLVLIFILSILTLNLKAQLTADFPDSNYHWNESHWTRACDGTCPFYYVEGTVYDSSSISFNNKVYRVLYFKGTNYRLLTHLFPTVRDNIENYTKLIGYIYNDKLNKKVYFRDTLNNSIDQLLYDFNLNLGDKYPVTKQNIQVRDSTYIFRIDTITDTYGIRRTVKYVSGMGANLYGSGAIIEGIGSLTGLLSNTIYGNYGWSESNELSCFSFDTLSYSVGNSLPSPFYFGSNNPCERHLYLSIESEKITILNIYPNPTTSEFSINIPEEEARFTLINSLGQSSELIGTRENGQWKFNIAEYPTGIYYIRINTIDDNYYFGSFAKL